MTSIGNLVIKYDVVKLQSNTPSNAHFSIKF